MMGEFHDRIKDRLQERKDLRKGWLNLLVKILIVLFVISILKGFSSSNIVNFVQFWHPNTTTTQNGGDR